MQHRWMMVLPWFVCVLWGAATARGGEPVRNDGKPEGAGSGISQLIIPESTPWKEELEKITFEGRFVTGKDLSILDSFFSPDVRAIDNSTVHRSIYLVIRVTMTQRTGPLLISLTVRPVCEEWKWASPATVKITNFVTKTGVIYECKRVLGASAGRTEGFREGLLTNQWKFEVVDAFFK